MATPTTKDRVRSMLDAGPVPFAALTIVERNEMVRLCRRGIATNIRWGKPMYYVKQDLTVRELLLRLPIATKAVR